MEGSETSLCKEHGYRKVGQQLMLSILATHQSGAQLLSWDLLSLSPWEFIFDPLHWIPCMSVRLQKPCQLFYLRITCRLKWVAELVLVSEGTHWSWLCKYWENCKLIQLLLKGRTVSARVNEHLPVWHSQELQVDRKQTEVPSSFSSPPASL